MGLKPDFPQDGKMLSFHAIQSDARRAADSIANQLNLVFASKGWIIVQ